MTWAKTSLNRHNSECVPKGYELTKGKNEKKKEGNAPRSFKGDNLRRETQVKVRCRGRNLSTPSKERWGSHAKEVPKGALAIGPATGLARSGQKNGFPNRKLRQWLGETCVRKPRAGGPAKVPTHESADMRAQHTTCIKKREGTHTGLSWWGESLSPKAGKNPPQIHQSRRRKIGHHGIRMPTSNHGQLKVAW